MDGLVLHGGTYGPYHTFGDGVVIENGVFQAPVYFGKGAVLVNPTFVRCCYPYYSNPWSRTGEGSVIDGGVWDYVDFGMNNTLKSGVGIAFSMGFGSTINAPPRKKGRGGKWESGGHIITGSEYYQLADRGTRCTCENDWDKEVKHKGYLIIGDDGTATVRVPRLLVECK